jgi:DNA invertase Pin-like site-specific DNA recombinase
LVRVTPPCGVYLRASTDSQDASRARAQVEKFAADHNLVIAASYVENESGASCSDLIVPPHLGQPAG